MNLLERIKKLFERRQPKKPKVGINLKANSNFTLRLSIPYGHKYGRYADELSPYIEKLLKAQFDADLNSVLDELVRRIERIVESDTPVLAIDDWVEDVKIITGGTA